MKVIRDPLWNNIRVEPLALKLIDTPAFQRLRYVRQLGLVFLVYPGATHSRFEHAIGTYHLASRTLKLLDEQGELSGVDSEERDLVRAAALLHDIGHYPFSHALEEIGALNHEQVARPLICEGDVGRVLRHGLGNDAPDQIVQLIRGSSNSALQGLISSSLDVDKIEYLRRDALMCGVPYGEIDAERLISSLVVLRRSPHSTLQPRTIGIHEKGISAVESLLFAKYQMFRNVYWHHAVRSATAMYKRLVSDAIDTGTLTVEQLIGLTDEGLLTSLHERAPSPLLKALRERNLYKRIAGLPAAELPRGRAEWISDDWRLAVAIENLLARELGLAPGELLLDYPAKTEMLGLDLPVRRYDGAIENLGQWKTQTSINLPRLSDEFYRSARWLRVYSARPVTLTVERLLELTDLTNEELSDAVRRDAFLK